eukprot:gb/GEZJ01005288.1/.p1 GENE.gb/GEZJ01005288.1/~~gb/GEZJ01005288.1/.p1  ORF type:complete len:135 (-),score=13.22 gb/GEZJ01005288.1/:563-967(-)
MEPWTQPTMYIFEPFKFSDNDATLGGSHDSREHIGYKNARRLSMDGPTLTANRRDAPMQRSISYRFEDSVNILKLAPRREYGKDDTKASAIVQAQKNTAWIEWFRSSCSQIELLLPDGLLLLNSGESSRVVRTA